jgi:Flp pilus assembly protein TadG
MTETNVTPMKVSQTTARRGERGVVIIWTAFFMVLMLGFVAIGIDVAKVMATRTELQNAADAAALAGASALNLTTGKVRPDSALIRAQETSLRNEAFVDSPKPVTLLPGDVMVDPALNTVQVTVRRTAASDGAMITHIAQVLGIKNVDLSATATAKADLTCSQCEKMVPLGAVPLNGQPNFQVGCANSYTLKRGGGNSISPGNYQAVDFPECNEGACAGMGSTGANTFRCLLANGYACCISIGQVIQTEPGAMTGPTNQGLKARWDSDTDRRTGICYSDYVGNGSRVVNVPIITPIGNGRTSVTVTGLAAFFLTNSPPGNGDVKAEFIHDVVPGTGGGCNSTVYTLRLIQ